MEDKTLLWEMFKVYIRGVLIGQKAYLTRKHEAVTKNMKEVIARLEQNHKELPKHETKKRLEAEASKLKLTEASQVAKQLMYSKQMLFEYRDKPNTLLTNLLGGKCDKNASIFNH